MAQAKIGVIGGTGLYQMEGMTDIEEVRPQTPFGPPSDSILIGAVEGTGIAFLPRHGRGHTFNPTHVPSRANIFALKSLGVEWIIAINSAGSFREEIRPGELVIPDQVIDRTSGRANTFFESGLVVHIPFGDPFCPVLSQLLYWSARETGAAVHKGGTYVTMEGPAFSTKAESHLYRSWGASIIGMTILPEAKLAREAEICYASVCCVCDYDVWREGYKPVTVEMITHIMTSNITTAQKVIRLAARRLPATRECQCPDALTNSIVTHPGSIPEEVKQDLALLIGKYV